MRDGIQIIKQAILTQRGARKATRTQTAQEGRKVIHVTEGREEIMLMLRAAEAVIGKRAEKLTPQRREIGERALLHVLAGRLPAVTWDLTHTNKGERPRDVQRKVEAKVVEGVRMTQQAAAQARRAWRTASKAEVAQRAANTPNAKERSNMGICVRIWQQSEEAITVAEWAAQRRAAEETVDYSAGRHTHSNKWSIEQMQTVSVTQALGCRHIRARE